MKFFLLRLTYRATSLLPVCLLATCLLNTRPSWTQTTGKAATPESSSEPSGFSIESEMLTYRALESNSEAIACDVAGYLQGTLPNFDKAGTGEACTFKPNTGFSSGVLVTTFDQSVFDNLRLWRVDMDTMAGLRARAVAMSCPAGSAVLATSARGSTPATSTALSFTPVGSALSLAQTTLALLSSEVTTSPVTGTIQDPAFQDAVARQLRGLNVAVLMPFTYAPFTISRRGASVSPFLSSLDALLNARTCLDTPAATPAAKTLLAEIDAFTAQLHAASAVAAKAVTSGTTLAVTAPAPAAVTQPHLLAALSADELAQKMGVDPITGLFPDNGPFQHVLLLRALESGGAVEKHTSVLGSRLRYSGGSVGTFALFSLAGDLECSGNVYDYGGSIAAKNFERDLRAYKPDPRHQYLFQRGSCRALPTDPR
jgi:hypothetical protein